MVREDVSSVLDLLVERAAAAPNHVAFRLLSSEGSAREITLPEFLERVDRVATRLLREGVEAGDRVAILGATSFGWAVAEWSIYRVGGVVVPLYETAPRETLLAALDRTGCNVAFVDESRVEQWRSVENLTVLEIRPGDQLAEDIGLSPSKQEIRELDRRRRRREDPATIVFTSGTNGEPRGTVIAHRNLIDLVLNVQAAWSVVLSEQGATVIFLPLAHVLARGLQAICLWAGMRVSYVADAGAVVRSLPQLEPTFLVVVPRVLEKIRDAAREAAARGGLGWLWADAERVAIETGRAAEAADRSGEPYALPRSLEWRHAMYRHLFYERLRVKLGRRLRFMLSGAAPLDPELSLFFRGIGIPVMEGYGLTETTAPLAGNRPGHIRSGSVGEPVPGTAVRRDDTGMLWVKGIGVCQGYLDEAQTDEEFVDGWLRTGDLGEIDEDGYIYLTGRAKDVVVTSGGKTISPARWTRAVETDPLVAHALVIGDGRRYPSAVLFLEPTPEVSLPSDAGLGERARLVTDQEIRFKLSKTVDYANSTVARSESIKRFAVVVADLSPEAGWLTATLKLRRGVVEKRLSAVIQSLYEEHK